MQEERTANFIHFADWSQINYHVHLPSIIPAIEKILKNEHIDAIIINGDLGYEINYNVHHHLEFMTLLSSLSSRTPIIFNRGNH